MRGRKPKPTALHNLHGTGNSTRLKLRKTEPVANGELFEPPDWLTDAQKDSWRYVIAHAPAGVLRMIDRGTLVVWVEAECRHRMAMQQQAILDSGRTLPLLTKGKGGEPIVSLYLGIIQKAALVMIKAASELGFSPASRPRLANGGGVAEPADQNDPWAVLKSLEHDKSTTNH